MKSRPLRNVIRNQTVLTLPPDATVRDAASAMAEKHVGSAMVVDGRGRLAGIFTERDALFRVLAHDIDPATTRLAEVMTPHLTTIGPEGTLSQALHLMHDAGVRHIPVVEDGRPVGVVSIRDALGRELASFERETRMKQSVTEILG